MKKVYVSFGTNNIKEQRRIVEKLKSLGLETNNMDFVVPRNENAKNDDVYFLAKSIEKMSEADVIFFSEGWIYSRRCNIERQIAHEYGLELLFYDDIGDIE